MKIEDWLGFIVILIICFCFFRFFIKQTVKKFFKCFEYDIDKIERKLDNLECDIARCREEIRKTNFNFESIQEEINIINEKLVVGKKNERICQLVDEKKELEEEIERLNKINQEFAKNYWDRINNISYNPFITPRPWGYF